MRTVKVDVKDVDDGVTVYHDGTEVLHVHYMHEGDTVFQASKGDKVKIVIHNLTGGDWHADIKVKISGKTRLNKGHSGWSIAGQPEAWKKSL